MAGTVAGTGFVETNVKWSINGYIYGNMPMMTMKKGDHVRWYVATLGDFNNGHTPHWHGNTVLVAGQRTDVIVRHFGADDHGGHGSGCTRHLALSLPHQRPHACRHGGAV